MTNNLNSVIIEGTVQNCEKVDKAIFFRVLSRRYFKDCAGEIHEEINHFDIEVYGKLAEACDSIITDGTGVRVVGRLKSINYENFKVVIYAEHIEPKPITVENK